MPRRPSPCRWLLASRLPTRKAERLLLTRYVRGALVSRAGYIFIKKEFYILLASYYASPSYRSRLKIGNKIKVLSGSRRDLEGRPLFELCVVNVEAPEDLKKGL
ncbi:hypothetical protein BDP67DRAFT_491793 [Colletotrichum lupini]|nr:hypothetical protein BDP67DRAFT_491793 [Colletotrichum lupini]